MAKTKESRKKAKNSSKTVCIKCKGPKKGRKYTASPPKTCPRCGRLTGTFFKVQ